MELSFFQKLNQLLISFLSNMQLFSLKRFNVLIIWDMYSFCYAVNLSKNT